MALTALERLEPRRVCLIKPSALGDIVQTLPVLAGLHKRWPEADFTWVVNRSFAGVLAGHPQLAGVIPFDRRATGLRRAQSTWSLAQRLRQGRFDLAIDLQGLLRSGLMTWATRATRRVGFADAREGAAHCYTDHVALPSSHMAAVPKYWRVAQALGCDGPPPRAVLGIGRHDWAFAHHALAHLPAPRLAICPGAQWETKRWPPKFFAELACRAIAARGAGIVVVGGPGEEELGARVAALIPGAVTNLVGKTTLLELSAVLASCDCLLSGDTGPMHLAAAVETPVVSVFTCTSPGRAAPHGRGHRVVATGVPCAASYLRVCPNMLCMNDVVPNRVWPALASTLETANDRLLSRAG